MIARCGQQGRMQSIIYSNDNDHYIDSKVHKSIATQLLLVLIFIAVVCESSSSWPPFPSGSEVRALP